jgi:hypothetical protein
MADRRSIDAMPRVSVGPARGRGVERRSRGRAATVVTERIQAEMAAEDQHAALRADVLLAVAAAEARPGEQSQVVAARRGVDLGEVAPALVPTSDFYNRHVRDRCLLDREITAGRFKDLPSYVPRAPRRADAGRSTGPPTGQEQRRARRVDAAGPGLVVPRRRSLPDHPRPLPRLDVTAADTAAMTAVLTHC